jgi:glucokinase
MRHKKILAFDVGGTTTKSAIIVNKEVIDFRDTPTPIKLSEFLELIKLTINHYKKLHQFDHIGMGLPGLINYPQQTALVCPNLPYLNNFSPKIFNYDIRIANDTDLALAGEMNLNKILSDCALFTLGTGVGGAISIFGIKPFNIPYSGEFGHIKISLDGPQCSCGQRSCLESYIGSKPLLKEIRAKISPQIENVEELFRLCKDSNPKAIEIVQKFSDYLAIAIANVVNITGIQTIILGGKISKSSDVFMNLLKPRLIDKISFYQYRDLNIRVALNSEKSALFGVTSLFD